MKTVTCLALSLVVTFCFAQKPPTDFKTFNPRFEVLELPGGVLGNSVQGIVQDGAGFLWFASQEGLHRYDGQTFFTYRYDPLDSNSLASDYCEFIFLDSRGVLWLAHYNRGGVTAFDPATEKFTRYRNDPNNPETLSSSTNSVIAEDREGNIWVGGDGGVDRLDRKTGKFKRFGHNPADSRSLSYGQVRGLYVDKQGTVWVGTGFTWDAADPQRKLGGLNRYDPKTETFTRYLHDPNDPTTLAHNQVRAIFEDSRGNFWVGTGGDGLHLLDRKTGKFTRLSYDPANPAKLSSPFRRGLSLASQPGESHVSSIFEDLDGRIWITAVMGGLNVHDPRGFGAGSASDAVRHFEAAPGVGNLSTNFLWHTFQSADGVIWIATGNGGGTVFKVKKQGERLPYFLPDIGIGGVRVGDVVKDKAGNIWIGYVNIPAFPLVRYDRKSGKSFPVAGSNAASVSGGLDAQAINTMLPDREGFLWVGTDNGLYRYDPQYDKFKHFPHPLLNTFWVTHLLQDRNGHIWTGNWQIGLSRLDPKTGVFTVFRHDPADPSSIGGTAISGLYEDAEGALWVGGGNGNDLKFPFFFDRFNPTDGQGSFTHFIKEKEAGMAECLTADDEGNIWFLGFGGIQKLNLTTGVRQKITASNSNLLSRALTSMARAKNGKFWLNANDGFIYELDPKTADFRAYGKQHGVPTGAHEFSEVFVADDGEVLIGRAGGFLAFYPDSLRFEKNSRPPDVSITDFHLLEERVIPGSPDQGRGVLKKPIWQTSELWLAHDQNVFSFSVACFDFADPASNQLQFMLENYDKGWRKDLRDGETPSYVNVPPGEYTFRVRGANSLGTWNMEGTSLRITISPPWWKTWWAYTFYMLCFIVGLFFVNRFLRERIAEKERAKSRERELAQAQEIEKAYHELKATQAQLEVRNRDLEIEAALERVRGQAMSMGTSDELSGLVATVFSELTQLDFRLDHCIIWIFDADTLSARVWTAGVDIGKSPESYFIKQLDHPYYRSIINGWKAKNPKWVYALSGDEKKSMDDLLLNETELNRLPDSMKTGIRTADHVHVAISFNNFGGLEASGLEPLSEENLDIQSRFGKVFDLTYTRFLDLKKAEAQAREGQIELALERVRSRTMAMQHSSELAETSFLLAQQVRGLGIKAWGCAFNIFDENDNSSTEWFSNEEGYLPTYKTPREGIFLRYYEAYQRGESLHVEEFAGEACAAHYKFLSTLPDLWEILKKYAESGIALPTYQIDHVTFFKQGYVLFITYEPVPEAHDIFKRFAKVFEQTYTRFLDLQKAEAQAFDLVQEKQRLVNTLTELRATQSQLIQSEKLASLGELTAGIAHEIQNPLNFVNNFAELSLELAQELKEEIEKPDLDKELVQDLVSDLSQNQEKINHHGKRAAAIVTGMLQHARTSTGKKEPTDLNALADEYLRLSYHGLRAKDSSFNAEMVTDFDPAVGMVEVIPQDIGRVFLNIINNAFYATQQRKAENAGRVQNPASVETAYEPTVSISSKRTDSGVEFRIKDNGTGIPDDVKARIFQPFFTTKPTGQGTGLGLSLAYDIVVKGHGGTLEVETKEGEGTEFIVQLPIK